MREERKEEILFEGGDKRQNIIFSKENDENIIPGVNGPKVYYCASLDRRKPGGFILLL